jgi:serine/threonine protein kinase
VFVNRAAQRLNREAWAWHDLAHPNVLPFYGISNDAGGKNTSPALISPLCTKGHVLDYLKKNPDVDRLKLVVGVAKGLRYLHASNIVHGDLKGTNILVGDDCEPLLCDFGRSRIIGNRGFTTRVLGVLAYQAPELIHVMEEAATDAETDEEVPVDDSPIDKEIFSDKLTTKTDVYAYAMVALEIFTGKAPYYYIVNDFLRAKRIAEGEAPQRRRYNSQSLTDARWALLAECWVKDATARPEVDLILPRLV